MSLTHTFKAGKTVTVFQMSPRKGLFIEGRARIIGSVTGVDEYYDLVFENEPGNVYQRFIDREGQLHPDGYVQEFNKRLGIAA